MMIEASGLQVALDAEAGLVRALDGVALAIERGQTVALVGESGCGKSMTALALMRLLPDNGRVTAGSVTLDGNELLTLPERGMRRLRGARIGMIFQEPATHLNPVMQVGDQLLETITTHTPLRGRAASERAVQWLQRVGIPEPALRVSQYPFQLSGGQQQRVMIAIALAAEPDLLIADEPTTALDVTVQRQILDLLRDLQRERGLGLLLITHDLAVVAHMAHQVALMYAGQIVEQAPAEAFFAAPRHPYAHALLRALPDATPHGAPLQAIAGSVPPLSQAFHGCRYAARCDRAQPRCRTEVPALGPAGAGRSVRCFFPVDERLPVVPPPTATAPASTGAAGTPLLELRSLRVGYAASGWRPWQRPVQMAVDGVSLTLRAGRTLALVGESGCGKSTLARAALQLLRGRARVDGAVLLAGRDLGRLRGGALRDARREIQIVFQDPYASLSPRLRVQAILEEGLRALRPDWTAAQRLLRLHTLLEQVGLPADALARLPHEFSGGQRQRLAIARALAVEPRVLVCDEPTSALDVSVQAQILNLLRRLQREQGLAYLFITHNLAVAAHLADEVAVMRQGRIVEHGPAAQVLRAPVHGYTRRLLAAAPRLYGADAHA